MKGINSLKFFGKHKNIAKGVYLMKKKFAIIFLVFLFFFIGCAKNENDNKVAQQYDFNNVEGLKVAQKAMLFISKNNIEDLKGISNEKAIEGLKVDKNSELVVTGYELNEISQKGNKALYTFYVLKAVPFKAKACIESCYIRIDKDKKDNSYKVGKIAAADILTGISYDEEIRIRKDSDVNMDTLIKLSEIPTETYTKELEEDITKVPVPKDEFVGLGFSFDKRNALVATKAGKKYYVASISFEDSKATAAGGEDSQQNNSNSNNGSINVKEKSIGKSISSIDIYDNDKVEFLIFSDDNKYIIVSFENQYGVKRFYFYRTEGENVELKLDEKFDEQKYSIIYDDCSNGKLFFDVSAEAGKEGVRADVIGRYCLTLKDMKLSKM